MKCAGMVVAGILAAVTAAQAAFSDDFSYPADSTLPTYYNVGGSKIGDSAQALTGSALKLTANTTGGSGFTQGYVPSVKLDTAGVGATWKISTVMSANWYGANELAGSYASAGLAIFGSSTNAGSGIQLQVKHEASSDKDYLEIAWAGTTIRSGWSSGSVTTVTTPYTIWIEKRSNGEIWYGLGAISLDKLASGSTGTAKSAYDLLNTLGSADLSVGMYINGQNYSLAGTNTTGLKVSASFDQLSVEGMNVVVPEAASAGLLGMGVIGLLAKRK